MLILSTVAGNLRLLIENIQKVSLRPLVMLNRSGGARR